MRLVPSADLATTLSRHRWNCRALMADWLPGDLMEALWQCPERLLASGAVLQHRGVRHSVRIDWGSQRFVLKYYAEPSWRHGLKQLVTRSRARKTWNMMHYMADCGVLTPRPVACIENTCGPLQLNSYLMYPHVAGETIKHLLTTQSEGWQIRSEMMPRFEALWRHLKSIEVSLQDANPGNFILGRDGQLWVIDLDKARRFRSAEAGEVQRQHTWRQLMFEMEELLQGRTPARVMRRRLAA